MDTWAFRAIRVIFWLYKSLFSPLLHLFFGSSFGCRFVPTCSEYSETAFREWGLMKGLYLTLRRISHCHPFARAGYDPVPHDIAGACYNSKTNLRR